jgi:hypothetical protein
MSESRADENAQLAPGDATPQHAVEQPHDPDPVAPEPLRSSQRNFAAILGALLLAVVALVLAAPYWAPGVVPLLPWGGGPETGSLEQRLAALESRAAADDAVQAAIDKTNRTVAGFDQRVGSLEQRSARPSAPPATVDLAPLRDEIARQQQALRSVEDRVAGIATSVEQRPAGDPAALQELRAATAKLGVALTDLDARLGKVAASEAGDSREDQALLLGLGQLRQALAGSAQFTADLAAATALAHDRPEVVAALTPLAADAARGVPSLAILQQRFAVRAGAIANAGTAAPAPADDWGSAALARLRGLVTVRRVGSAAVVSGGPQAAVATAEDALAAGDLPGAVAAMETLTGEATAAAKPWLDDARRRLAAETALDKASGFVTARLGQHAPGGAAEGRR